MGSLHSLHAGARCKNGEGGKYSGHIDIYTLKKCHGKIKKQTQLPDVVILSEARQNPNGPSSK